MEEIFAGIVLYNPDIERLKENVEHISGQVSKVVFVNNGSNNTQEIEDYVKKISNSIYIDLHDNKGIATALNVILKEAVKNSVKWVLTLDQDTVCFDDIIDNYRGYLDLDNVGQLTCVYKDRNFNDDNSSFLKDKVKKVPWCITSAALVNVDAWKAVNGFDEKLFIDEVDYDICLSMRENGYFIYQIGFVGFIHEIGEGKVVNVAGHNIKTWNHSPFRRYYSTRNAMLVARKHKELNSFKAFLGAVKHIFIIFLFEDTKWKKLKAGVKGLAAGIGERI